MGAGQRRWFILSKFGLEADMLYLTVVGSLVEERTTILMNGEETSLPHWVPEMQPTSRLDADLVPESEDLVCVWECGRG